MFKSFGFSLLLISVCGGSIVNVPKKPAEKIESLSNFEQSDLWSKWGPHIMDFVQLIDVEKVLAVLLSNINDPEVLNFIGFIMSDEFKEVVWEFESMAEFNEATSFLISKGYDVTSLINMINTGLNLPTIEKQKSVTTNRKGLTGVIEELVAALPVEEMKKLFESKLETIPEISDLFETINSEEFMEILDIMSQNSKFTEFKTVFESYGFDFKYLCALAKEIFGDYYQGIFCD